MTLYTREGFLLPLDLFRQRLRDGADPNEVWKGQHGDHLIVRQPLLCAVSANTTDYLRILLVHPRTLLNAADFQGRTVLHLAAQHGKDNAMQLLVAAGLPVNARDTYGQTALHYAMHIKGVRAIRCLLEGKADPDAIGADGRTPIHEALLQYTTFPHPIEEKVGLLMVSGCNLDHQDDRGLTPLFRAAYSGYTRIVHALLASGADPELRTHDGERPVDSVRRLILSGMANKQTGLDEVLSQLTCHTRKRLSHVALSNRAQIYRHDIDVARRM